MGFIVLLSVPIQLSWDMKRQIYKSSDSKLEEMNVFAGFRVHIRRM